VGGAVALLAISLPSGKVELPAHPRLACAFGLRFGRWIAETAAPIIAAHATAPPSPPCYRHRFVCRNRNGDNADKLSEHGRGNAIDVVGFELTDHRRVTIGDAALAGPLAVALKGLRTSACGYFTTVLGPGLRNGAQGPSPLRPGPSWQIRQLLDLPIAATFPPLRFRDLSLMSTGTATARQRQSPRDCGEYGRTAPQR
jgi:hypothetical protein